jgi:hypothetical protein
MIADTAFLCFEPLISLDADFDRVRNSGDGLIEIRTRLSPTLRTKAKTRLEAGLLGFATGSF